MTAGSATDSRSASLTGTSGSGEPVTYVVVGAGSRGQGYSAWIAENPEAAQLVGVAEPNAVRRERLASAHGVDAAARFDDWRLLLERPRLADAVIVSTQDRDHLEPAVALMKHGYHVLLEKPMALSLEECRVITAAAERSGVIFAVCHVLLYTAYTEQLESLLRAGRIGDVISVEHLEPVGFWHQAHSYVRGNWRREDESTFMLMAKSCHDVDWLQHVVGRPISRVASFGGLAHFRAEHHPEGAADRCVDCRLSETCTYSATTFYGGLLASGNTGWPLNTVVETFDVESVDRALKEGPYGRCVYTCDNDVVDHQVLAIEFDGGATATFTMTAFTLADHRQTRIFGSGGQVTGDGRHLEVVDFATGETERIDTRALGDATAAGGHGGGDAGLMAAFTSAVATGDRDRLRSGPAATLASHTAVFAAEAARREGTVQVVPASLSVASAGSPGQR